MQIKQLLFLRDIKQVHVVKALKVSPSVLSLYLNGWRGLPRRYEEALAKFLGLTKEEVVKNFANPGREKVGMKKISYYPSN